LALLLSEVLLGVPTPPRGVLNAVPSMLCEGTVE
jgi:hypothetical protein